MTVVVLMSLLTSHSGCVVNVMECCPRFVSNDDLVERNGERNRRTKNWGNFCTGRLSCLAVAAERVRVRQVMLMTVVVLMSCKSWKCFAYLVQ